VRGKKMNQIVKSANFDDLINERIGYGRYQKIVCGLLSLILIADGMEMAALSILLPILTYEWEISHEVQTLLGSVLFLGMFLGSLLAGFITDHFGRKRTLEYSSLATFLLGIYSTTITNVYLFLFVRGAFGFLIGFLVPTVPTLVVEILPLEKRGKLIALINTAFSFGQIIACIVAYFLLDNLRSGNWRLMLLICSITPIFVFIGTKMSMYESPRYEIIMGRTENGIEILNNLGKINQGQAFKPFTDSEIESLEVWARNLKIEDTKEKKNVGMLFSSKLKRITICNWTMWFSMNFVYYGMVLILPYFLSNLKNGKTALLKLVFITTLESLTYFLIHALIDHPKIGRKYLIFLGLGVSGITSLLSLFQNIDGIILIGLFALGRFFSKMCFAVVFSFTAELYPTPLRTLGVGFSSAFGRVGSFIMPFITLNLYYVDPFYPFFVFAFFGFLGAWASHCIPHDTAGTYLDTDHSNYFPIEQTTEFFNIPAIQLQSEDENQK
jgi:MFS transporter, putative metabolite:H+ symporter